MVGISIAIDSLVFGKLTWTAFNFVKFNVIEDKSAQYGIYNPSWYFTAGIPLILLTWYPFFLAGIYYAFKKGCLREQFLLIFFETLVLSINPHKEDRFLMKVIPFTIYLAGIGLKNLYVSSKEKIKTSVVLKVLIFINLFFFIYSGMIDKRGSIDVMHHLREHGKEIKSLYMLTECHRTPYYAMIH